MGTQSFQSRGAVIHHTGEEFCDPSSATTENSLAGMCGELASIHSSPRGEDVLVNYTFLAGLDWFQNSCLKFLMEIRLGKLITIGNEWQHNTGQPCNLPRSCFYWKENDKSLVAATTIPWIQRCQKRSFPEILHNQPHYNLHRGKNIPGLSEFWLWGKSCCLAFEG